MTASFLDELEAITAEVRDTAEKVLPVPFSGGKLGVRFRVPSDPEVITPVIAAYRMHAALTSEQAKQFLIDCCDEIVKRNGDGEWVPRDPDGGPLRFDAGDERWGPDVKTARDCVAKLYNLATKPIAHQGHAEILLDWLQGIDAEVAARVEGESPGGDSS